MVPGNQCTVCSHPERPIIDIALAEGTISYANIGKKYGFTKKTVHHHTKHRAKRTHEPTIIEGSTDDRIEATLRIYYKLLTDDEAAVAANGKPKISMSAKSQIVRAIPSLLSMRARLTGELDDPQQALRVALETPEFQAYIKTLLAALKAIPGAVEAARPALEALNKAAHE